MKTFIMLYVIVFEHPQGFWQSLDTVINACLAKLYFLFATAILSLLLVDYFFLDGN